VVTQIYHLVVVVLDVQDVRGATAEYNRVCVALSALSSFACFGLLRVQQQLRQRLYFRTGSSQSE
jgi:hypothetical protein